MVTMDKGTLTELCAIARAAGAVIMRHYGKSIAVRRKDDRSPVTDADEDAEKLIIAALRKLMPSIPIVAEEQAAAGAVPPASDTFFLVDPLDGTREFLDRNGEFTVNIALIADRVPVAGVVFAPAKERMFAGARGLDAFEWRNGQPHAITARRPPPEGLTALTSRSHRAPAEDAYLQGYKIRETIVAGSSLKFCLIAAGEADIYPRHGDTMEWDTAAGDAVLRAAGGRVTLLDGKTPLNYGKRTEGYRNPHFVAWGAPASQSA